jgi:hypothetical protein
MASRAVLFEKIKMVVPIRWKPERGSHQYRSAALEFQFAAVLAKGPTVEVTTVLMLLSSAPFPMADITAAV